ncbi:MAG: hypothetical protein IH617_17790 [Hydrogenophaga sp.]|nr:hypothetical protein [Hydrogenophaga sp.]
MALIAKDILGQAQAFVQSAGQAMLERALNWAYLSKAEGSFAIEGEAPSADKATLFAGPAQARPRTAPPDRGSAGGAAERGHLQALTAFSQPARQLCQVTWAGDEHCRDDWVPEADTWFRHMDLTEAVSFTLATAEASLDTQMRKEVAFLGLFDRVKRHINSATTCWAATWPR